MPPFTPERWRAVSPLLDEAAPVRLILIPAEQRSIAVQKLIQFRFELPQLLLVHEPTSQEEKAD